MSKTPLEVGFKKMGKLYRKGFGMDALGGCKVFTVNTLRIPNLQIHCIVDGTKVEVLAILDGRTKEPILPSKGTVLEIADAVRAAIKAEGKEREQIEVQEED